MRSATVVLVAVTVRSCNAFSICNSDSGFHSSHWGGLTYCDYDQRVSFLRAWSRLKPLLALPNDHFSSEGTDNEKWPWWDFSTMSKLLKVWHVSNPEARTSVSMEFSLHLLALILLSMLSRNLCTGWDVSINLLYLSRWWLRNILLFTRASIRCRKLVV